MKKRLFIAINIPESIKEKIHDLFLSKISDENFKTVKKENLHITLLFLGYVQEEKIQGIEKSLKEISESRKSFELALSGLGQFNNRVVWIGCRGEYSAEAEKLAKAIHAKLNFHDEKFHSHLTIARKRKKDCTESKKSVADLLHKLSSSSKEFNENFKVNSFELMESFLSGKGSYKVIKSFKLEE